MLDLEALMPLNRPTTRQVLAMPWPSALLNASSSSALSSPAATLLAHLSAFARLSRIIRRRALAFFLQMLLDRPAVRCPGAVPRLQCRR